MGAGEVKVMNLAGRFLEIVEAQYPISIGFVDRNGNALEDGGIVNCESGIFVDLAPVGGYAAFTVSSAVAQPIRLLYGGGMGGSRRQPGVVQVVDGARARTLAGAAFAGYAFQPLLAANTALIQLWNPSGSGRRAVIERVGVLTDTTNNGAWLTDTVGQLATLVAQGKSKLSGGAASIMQIRRANDPASPSAMPFDAFAVPASSKLSHPLPPQSPIVVLPNQGVTLWGTGVGVALGGTFEWYEEVI